MTQTTKASSEVAYLCRALKAPSLARSFERLAERARSEEWTHKEFLAACLEREVSARQTNGGELRIKATRFPARKTIEDFDFTFQRSLKRDTVLHLGTLDFVAARENVVCAHLTTRRRTSSRFQRADTRVSPRRTGRSVHRRWVPRTGRCHQ